MTQLGQDIINATLGNAQTLLLVPASCRPALPARARNALLACQYPYPPCSGGRATIIPLGSAAGVQCKLQ